MKILYRKAKCEFTRLPIEKTMQPAQVGLRRFGQIRPDPRLCDNSASSRLAHFDEFGIYGNFGVSGIVI
jgi:hypothetical protein